MKNQTMKTSIGLIASLIAIFCFLTGYKSLPEIPLVEKSIRFSGDVISIMFKPFIRNRTPSTNSKNQYAIREYEPGSQKEPSECLSYLLGIGFEKPQIDMLLRRGYLTYGEHLATGGKQLEVFEYCCWPSAGELTLAEVEEYMRKHGIEKDYITFLRQNGFKEWNIENLKRYGKIDIATVRPEYRNLFRETADCYTANCTLTMDMIRTYLHQTDICQ